jgi:drug/metabolite transporter (DMT)-like permease
LLRPILALATAAAIWGISFPIVKDAYADISPLLLLAIRFGLGAVLMPLAAFRGILQTRPLPRTLRGGALTGVFVGCGMVAQMLGLRDSSAANTGFLTSLYIVLVPFVAYLVYRSRVQVQEWWAVVLAGGGIALLSLDPRTLSFAAGDWLTMVSAMFFAFQVVLVQRFSSEGQEAWVAWLQIAVTAAVAGLAVGVGLEGESFLRGTPRLYWALGFTVIGPTVAAFLLQSWGQRHTTATRAALIFATEPVFAGLASTWLLSETWPPRRLTGAALILGAILVAEVKLKPRRNREHISK